MRQSWRTLQCLAGIALFGVVGLLAARSAPAQAGPPFVGSPALSYSEVRWVERFGGYLDLNGNVFALAVSGTDVYVGGDFTRAGGLPARGIARWDGAQWHPLGTGIDEIIPFAGGVRAIAVNGPDVYIGGMFAGVDGVPVNNVARWDGARWHALGGGVSNEPGLGSGVQAIAVLGTSVYVGGYFTRAGQVMASGIARWDGAQWHPLGSGVGDEFGGAAGVHTIAVTDTDVYAGGGFFVAGGVRTLPIARWDGSRWHALGSGVGGPVNALVVVDDDVYASGMFYWAGESNAQHIARWDGTAWHALGSVIDSWEVTHMTASDGQVYATYPMFTDEAWANHIGRWDGSAWHTVDTWSDGHGVVLAIAVTGSEIYAGGNLKEIRGQAVDQIARWDASGWRRLGSGHNGGLNREVLAVAIQGSDVYVGGWFTEAGGVAANNIARWDGAEWHALGSGTNGRVQALAIDGTNVYAGGQFTEAGGKVVNYIARWDGSAWHELDSGIAGDMYAAVHAIAVNGGNVYAGGMFSGAGATAAENIARWDGSRWHALGGTVSSVMALAASGSNLYVGADYVQNGNLFAQGIARWDGTRWHALGNGMNGTGYASAIAVSGSNVYAGGPFTMAGDGFVRFIARWDGSRWHPLGGGLNSTVSDIAIDGTDVYIGGEFSVTRMQEWGEPTSVNHVARWDGTRWHALGSGAGAPVASIAMMGGDLYAGGFFTEVSGLSSNYIARWGEASGVAIDRDPETLPGDLHIEQNYPNPFNPVTTLRFHLPSAGFVTLTVYDVLGREVATLVSDHLSAGDHAARWDAAGLSGGTYFALLRADMRTHGRKLTLVK